MPSNETSDPQMTMDFTGGGAGDGRDCWEEHWIAAQRALARQLGIPLGRKVRATIRNGIELHGLLKLNVPLLLIPAGTERRVELRVDGVVFALHELESWVVTDS